METIKQFAYVEENGKVKILASSPSPEVDGYTLTTIDGYPFHVHPEATPEIWNLLQSGVAADEVDIVNYQPKIIDKNDAINQQIFEIESTITQRRLRDAILSADGGWLKAANQKIADLRAQID